MFNFQEIRRCYFRRPILVIFLYNLSKFFNINLLLTLLLTLLITLLLTLY